MNFISLLIVSVALSLDAFGVALSLGLMPNMNRNKKLTFCVSFGFFQFLFSFLGSFAGSLFIKYIASVPNIIGGAIIIIVGLFMIKEGIGDEEKKIFYGKKMYVILGISVSIDALVVGFTVLNLFSFINITLYTVFIGIVTFLFSVIAFILSGYLNKINIISKYADYIGGVILVLFGLRMIFL